LVRDFLIYCKNLQIKQLELGKNKKTPIYKRFETLFIVLF